MIPTLIGLHAGLGEIGVFAFLWVLVEILELTESRLARARLAAAMGTVSLFAAWLTGGYYYVSFYGTGAKTLVKAGPFPWAHSIFTETKEHVFLFLPFLALFVAALLYTRRKDLLENSELRKALIFLCAVIILLGLAMAGMGYLISMAARQSLEMKLP